MELPPGHEFPEMRHLHRVAEGGECEPLRPEFSELPCFRNVCVGRDIQEVVVDDQPEVEETLGGRWRRPISDMRDMPDDLGGEILPRAGGLALEGVHSDVGVVSDGVGEGVGAVEADVEDGEGRRRHCAGVTAIWEVTDRDDRVSHPELPPTLRGS